MPKLESGQLEPRSDCKCGELNDPGEDFVIPEANDNDNDNDDDDDDDIEIIDLNADVPTTSGEHSGNYLQRQRRAFLLRVRAYGNCPTIDDMSLEDMSLEAFRINSHLKKAMCLLDLNLRSTFTHVKNIKHKRLLQFHPDKALTEKDKKQNHIVSQCVLHAASVYEKYLALRDAN